MEVQRWKKLILAMGLKEDFKKEEVSKQDLEQLHFNRKKKMQEGNFSEGKANKIVYFKPSY